MTRPLLLWTAAALLVGCGPSRPLTPADVRARLPALEARAEADPADAAALRELGRAYARLGDYDRARDALGRADRLAPGDAGTAYALGLVAEAEGRPAQALARYRAVGGAAPYGPLADARRAALVDRAVRAEVDSLLDAERYPDPVEGVVAVFPLRADPALRPLARALTALLADDLAALGLRPVEPGRVDALLDALALDPAAVGNDRAGRLARVLQADRVVAGTLVAQGDSLRAEAALWDGGAPPAPAEASGDVFAVEAGLLRAFAAQAGVDLSEAELARLARPPTRDADALAAYGRGLVEEDAGRYAGAAALYAEAARLDPAFALAADRAAGAQAREAAAASVPAALAGADRLGPSVAAARLVGRRLAHVGQSLGVHAPAPEGEREPAAEVPLAPPTAVLPEPPRPPGRNQ